MIRSRHRVPFLRALLAALWLLAPIAAAGQELEEPQSLEEALVAQGQYISQLRQAIDERPDEEAVWQALLQAEGMLRAMRVQAGLEPRPEGPKASQVVQEKLTDRVYGEWIARSPGLPAPYLARGRAHSDAARRLALLEEAAARFPDHAVAWRDLGRELDGQGRAAEAGRLLEDFAAAHPRDAEGWKELAAHHERQGNQVRAREARAAWLALDVDSAEALRARLDEAVQASDEEAARRVAARVTSALASAGDWGAVGFCEDISRPFQGALWAEAVECLEVVAAATGDEAVLGEAQTASARVVAKAGNVGEARRVLERLPAERRPRALLSIGSAFAWGGRCTEAVEAFDSLVGVRIEGVDVGSSAARSLGNSCRGSSEARRLVLRLLGTSEPSSAQSILRSWGEALDPGEVESVLRRRVAAEPEQDFLWMALDDHLAAHGDHVAREEHLRAWVEARPGHPVDRYLALAELVAVDEVEPAVVLLEEALEATGRDAKIVEALAGFYLMTDRVDRAEALAADLARAESRYAAGRGGLLLARLAWAGDDPERALDLYRRLLARDEVPPEAAREAGQVLAELGRDDEAVELLAGRYDAALERGVHLGVARDVYLARELAEVGLEEAALAAWMRAIAEGGVDADGLRAAGDLARGLERWREAELAYGQLLELDPQNGHLWSLVAGLAADRGDHPALERLAEQARTATGSVPPRVGLPLARALLEQGDVVRAITILRDARRQNLFDPEISRTLDEAYVRLARQR
jgi:predicted Zn-dependent protease